MSKYEKRDSPPVSAQDFPNKIKVGNDGKDYISRPDKNKVYHWFKLKNMEECNNPEKYYMQFPENYLQKKFYKYEIKSFEKTMKPLQIELKKKDIYLLKIGWEGVWNFMDNAWYDARVIIKQKYFKNDKKISDFDVLRLANFIFYTEKGLFWAQNEGNIYMQWNLNKEGKKEAFEIFKKYFKNKFIEPKSSSKTIIIKLPKL